MTTRAASSPGFHAARLVRFILVAKAAATLGDGPGYVLARRASRDAYWTLHDLGAGDEAKAILAEMCGPRKKVA